MSERADKKGPVCVVLSAVRSHGKRYWGGVNGWTANLDEALQFEDKRTARRLCPGEVVVPLAGERKAKRSI